MRNKKTFAVLLCLLLLPSLFGGCASFSAPSSSSPAVSAAAVTPEPPPPTESPRADYHTLRLSAASLPACWNPHCWQSETDYLICSLTTAPLVNLGLTEGTDGAPEDGWLYEMAESVEDVTGSWAKDADWAIDGSERGRVWRIRLRESACWNDEAATPITADSYLYSMQQLLSPEMDNYRAEAFCAGAAELLGANAYRHSGMDAWEENALPGGGFIYPPEDWRFDASGVCTASDGTPLCFSLTAPLRTWLDGSSLEDYYRAGYVPETVYSSLLDMADRAGYVPVTRKTMDLLHSFTGSDAWGRETEADLAYYTVFPRTWPKVSWDSVGLLKEDDYTLIYICAGETEEFDLLYALTVPWLVYEPLYEAGRFTFDGRSYTSYGTDVETSMSCGPYGLTELAERSLTLEKNDQWCAFTPGTYETDRITLELLSRSEAEKRFREGSLDLLLPGDGEALPQLPGATVLIQDDAYTYRFFMVTEEKTLRRLQEAASSDGTIVNKTCLSNAAFREALSFSLDRAALAAATEDACIPQLGIVNDIYLYDVAHDLNSRYRTSPYGMAAICGANGLSTADGLLAAYEGFTGYDLDRARRRFHLAYAQLLEAGLWTDEMTILLDCAVSGGTLTETQKKQNELLQQMLDTAAAGTGFEGKLFIRFCSREDRYAAVAAGKIEMGYGAWGGAAFDPYGLMQCYCDPSFNTVQESCGFDPETKLLTLLLDDAPDTRTYAGWCRALLPGGQFASDPQKRVTVLSLLEAALLKERRFLPIASGARKLLLSAKLEPGSETYSILTFFGGIRSLKYRYDDAQWALRG